MILTLLLLLQDYEHPYLASKDLTVVRVLEVGEPVLVKREGWPNHEYRGTVKLQVEESFLGPKKAGDVFTLPTVEYRLDGSDRPTTPWDFLQLQAGQRYLLTPGPEFPLIVEVKAPSQLEDVRSILRLKGLAPAEQGPALRQVLLQPTVSMTLGYATRDLIRRHPEVGANAESILGFLLRKDLPQERQLEWAWLLNRLSKPSLPWTEDGNRRLCAVWWRILDRGLPPEGEDPRLILHSLIGLGDYIWALGVTPPRTEDFIPAFCSKERILKALDYVRRNDQSRYIDGSKQLPEHPSLEKLRRYIGP